MIKSLFQTSCNYKRESKFGLPTIGVITVISNTAVVEVLLANLVEILEPLSNEMYVITGKFSYRFSTKVKIINIKNNIKKNESMLIKIIRYLIVQLKISFQLFKISANIDVIMFYVGAKSYFMPILLAKLLRKKTIVLATSPASSLFFEILEKIHYSLADQIVVESESVIMNHTVLNKYRKKISIGARYVNNRIFKIKTELKDKINLVGYIGRFSQEKGVMNFVEAIPLILKEQGDVEFLIAGDGLLFDKIKGTLKNKKLLHKVKMPGWVSHEDELPDYLNELKLLVLPSYLEGLPTIVLEAMACGAPVLATPVGGVPDVIKDGETGFILEDNSPECIAKNVIRALDNPRLDEIGGNARKHIEQKYTYEAAVERYRKILNNL